jgi:hypothetical protein
MGKQAFRVTGAVAFAGKKPGETVELDPDDPRTQRAVARGSVTAAGAQEKETLEAKSRAELDEIASRLGVNEPETLENKSAVISAIRSYDKE